MIFMLFIYTQFYHKKNHNNKIYIPNDPKNVETFPETRHVDVFYWPEKC